jgi:hypothetical protein
VGLRGGLGELVWLLCLVVPGVVCRPLRPQHRLSARQPGGAERQCVKKGGMRDGFLEVSFFVGWVGGWIGCGGVVGGFCCVCAFVRNREDCGRVKAQEMRTHTLARAQKENKRNACCCLSIKHVRHGHDAFLSSRLSFGSFATTSLSGLLSLLQKNRCFFARIPISLPPPPFPLPRCSRFPHSPLCTYQNNNNKMKVKDTHTLSHTRWW